MTCQKLITHKPIVSKDFLNMLASIEADINIVSQLILPVNGKITNTVKPLIYNYSISTLYISLIANIVTSDLN